MDTDFEHFKKMLLKHTIIYDHEYAFFDLN